ncbi:SpaH/EbpB family LPXTG-anchored major pilin [Gardnerella piotii]|uniref:SpaH/EbpB family LPXTG-anchored major pilin n=1 Tax=Gardnerella piotii TaxID=2792977 RepID=UPI0020108718|nr:SpaH/EbpB family LPXTG-anchored major pilin [Gardnerella piotii]UQA80649.1 SpaH/EbpB family LPXTG-anchored major pilin [Gardnerella piotii]
MNKLTKKCVAAIASLAMAGTLCVAGAVTMASVAWGVPRPDPNRGQQQPLGDSPDAPWYKKTSDTDPEPKTEGTLTIKKYKYKDSDDHKGEPLDGAKFTLTKVTKIDKVDLKYNEFSTWSTIAGIVDKLNRGDAAGAKITLGEGAGNVYTATTTNGTVEIKNLKAGLYKVVETPPAGYGAADMTEFYITMPLIGSMTSAGATKATTFNWSPEISPKNKDLSKSFSKKLDDGKGHNSVLAKDGTLDYTIKAKVNRTKSGDLTKDDISGFAVFDDFPTAAFGTNVESSAVKSVSFGDGDDAELTSNTDYEVSIVKASSEADGKNLESGRNRILVKFKDPGLTKIATKLNGAKNGDPDVKVNIELTLSDEYKNGNAPAKDQKSTENTTVVNKSGFFPASPKGTPDANKPDPIVSGDDEGTSTVKYGWFDVFKYDAADEGKQTKTGLKGAEFRLFNTEEKANACAKKLVDASKTADDVTECSAASSTFKGEEATTQDGGKLKAAVKVQADTTIYLVEVKAPEGYIRLPEVKAVNVEEGKLKTVPFSNTKKSSESNWAWFNLPATGAAGVILFALAGMGLIAASVFLYMRNRKEEEQQAKA